MLTFKKRPSRLLARVSSASRDHREASRGLARASRRILILSRSLLEADSIGGYRDDTFKVPTSTIVKLRTKGRLDLLGVVEVTSTSFSLPSHAESSFILIFSRLCFSLKSLCVQGIYAQLSGFLRVSSSTRFKQESIATAERQNIIHINIEEPIPSNDKIKLGVGDKNFTT